MSIAAAADLKDGDWKLCEEEQTAGREICLESRNFYHEAMRAESSKELPKKPEVQDFDSYTKEESSTLTKRIGDLVKNDIRKTGVRLEAVATDRSGDEKICSDRGMALGDACRATRLYFNEMTELAPDAKPPVKPVMFDKEYLTAGERKQLSARPAGAAAATEPAALTGLPAKDMELCQSQPEEEYAACAVSRKYLAKVMKAKSFSEFGQRPKEVSADYFTSTEIADLKAHTDKLLADKIRKP